MRILLTVEHIARNALKKWQNENEMREKRTVVKRIELLVENIKKKTEKSINAYIAEENCRKITITKLARFAEQRTESIWNKGEGKPE